MYGMRNEEPQLQPRGICRTLTGRVLAWPNTLPHRVRPFELADKTRSGKRTILCFFLVDPSIRIRSTATVPPQCRQWLDEVQRKVLDPIFPNEVTTKILEHMYGLSYEEACERRERLMKERGKAVYYDEEMRDFGLFFERPFFLCEH